MRVGDPDGYGRYAVLDINDDGQVLCHECGRWWAFLAVHVRRAHGMSAAGYRETHGLGASTPLAGTALRRTFREGTVARGDEVIATLAAHRNVDAARAAAGTRKGSQWAPEVRAKRAAISRARRGRALTAEEAAWLADADVDLQTWADRARVLLAADDVSARSLAEAADIATPTVLQRLRRYPPRA